MFRLVGGFILHMRLCPSRWADYNVIAVSEFYRSSGSCMLSPHIAR
jgi:hypothetical protein